LGKRINIDDILKLYKNTPAVAPNITGIIHYPPKDAKFRDFPEFVDPGLIKLYKQLGYDQLYSHQEEAIKTAVSGENFVIDTPTASGKSLCYQIPILQKKIESPGSRSLLLFPTKALAQDQLAGFGKITEFWKMVIGSDLKIYNYDGDTRASLRPIIRKAGSIVLSNPDMLHSGVLPNHTNWINIFENLDYIVIDELHTYRGVFGSHLTNLIRRLKRLCKFYGSMPKFLCASASIANPREHAENLIEEEIRLINQSGAPKAEKYVLYYNPAMIDPSSGLRKSPLREAVVLAKPLIDGKIPTIFFCRSRNQVEILLNHLRKAFPRHADAIKSYRGGYLPSERRKIEKDLRDGKIIAIVSTNALELGIDIGSLTASISVGYPGSISSLIQQYGRAGRRISTSLSILIASNTPMDQFLIQHPDEDRLSKPEKAIINPDNILIASDHIKCSGFELPFHENEMLGRYRETGDVLEVLGDHRVMVKVDDMYRWMSDTFPASNVSLRTAASENFVICDISKKGREKIIGEMDFFSAPTMLHDQAIYLHQGTPYYVEKLDWEERRADVAEVKVDYYTDAQEKVEIEILDEDKVLQNERCIIKKGEIALKIKAVLFKKIKWETNENIGWGQVNTPEITMHTQAGWILLNQNVEIPDKNIGQAFFSIAYCLKQVAPLFILCDKNDIHVRGETKSPVFERPCVLFYDRIPGGINLSYKLIELLDNILQRCIQLIKNCGCTNGCPACIGPSFEDDDLNRKKESLTLLESITC
jgi:DEAD/DEAH box helicase domain-containing protein